MYKISLVSLPLSH